MPRVLKPGVTEILCYRCQKTKPVAAYDANLEPGKTIASYCRSCRTEHMRLNGRVKARKAWDAGLLSRAPAPRVHSKIEAMVSHILVRPGWFQVEDILAETGLSSPVVRTCLTSLSAVGVLRRRNVAPKLPDGLKRHRPIAAQASDLTRSRIEYRVNIDQRKYSGQKTSMGLSPSLSSGSPLVSAGTTTSS